MEEKDKSGFDEVDMGFDFSNARKNIISFEKIWEDTDFFEVKICVESEYAFVWQNCYLCDRLIDDLSRIIVDFCAGKSETGYFESGSKTGNYTPAFSFQLTHDGRGHVTIETDIEIEDVDDRSHRCTCNVYTEIGLLEQFGARILGLKSGEIGTIVNLSGM